VKIYDIDIGHTNIRNVCDYIIVSITIILNNIIMFLRDESSKKYFPETITQKCQKSNYRIRDEDIRLLI